MLFTITKCSVARIFLGHFPEAVLYCIQNTTISQDKELEAHTVGHFLERTTTDLSVPTGWHCKQAQVTDVLESI